MNHRRPLKSEQQEEWRQQNQLSPLSLLGGANAWAPIHNLSQGAAFSTFDH